MQTGTNVEKFGHSFFNNIKTGFIAVLPNEFVRLRMLSFQNKTMVRSGVEIPYSSYKT